MWLAVIATVIIGALLYKFVRPGKKRYWQNHGILEIDTSSALGKLDVLLGRKSMGVADDFAYQHMGTHSKFCGVLDLGTPLIILKDMELIKKIFIKDFNYFIDRRPFWHENDGNVKNMLPSLEGEEWKGVRSSVSPTFTTGKIRRMMEFFNAVGKEWTEEYSRKVNSNPSGSVVIDVLTSVNQYTIEVISTAVFGIKADVIGNSEAMFMKMATRISDFSKVQMAKLAFRMYFPWINRLLGLSPLDTDALSFFEEILNQGLKSRMSGEASKRNDFLQLLVEAKKGELKAAGSDELSSFEKDAMISADSSSNKRQYLTEDIMNAQTLIFFFAGFSTTTNLISFTMYALAAHQTIQDRLRLEVEKIVKEDDSLDYDDVGQLVYMDMLICEVLRKFPAVVRLERLCVKEYRDPESGLVVPKGTVVAVPLNSVHHDERYYDNPDQFDPEHFSPEKKAARSPYAFAPFGIGPRNCVGMRFALTEAKSAIAHMVHHFMIEPTSKTPIPMQTKTVAIQVILPENLELKLTPINKKK